MNRYRGKDNQKFSKLGKVQWNGMAAIPKISHKLWAAKICIKVHIFHEFERVNKKPYTTCVLLIYSKLGDSFNSHQVLSRGYGWANPRNTSQPTYKYIKLRISTFLHLVKTNFFQSSYYSLWFFLYVNIRISLYLQLPIANKQTEFG